MANDIYLEVARWAGKVRDDTPPEEVRKTRAIFKTVVLGRLYGMGVERLQQRTGLSASAAEDLADTFDRLFRILKQWQDAVVRDARYTGYIETRMGWRAKVLPMTTVPTLLNWMIQSTGADILHVATLFLERAGLPVIATAHDGLLLEVPADTAELACEQASSIMTRSAKAVCGFAIGVDANIIGPGERYLKGDAVRNWTDVMASLA